MRYLIYYVTKQGRPIGAPPIAVEGTGRLVISHHQSIKSGRAEMDQTEKRFVAAVAGLFVVLALGSALHAWWRASTQQAVWAREGVHLTTWEVFMGAKPAERVIREAK